MVADQSSILSDESHLHFFYWGESILIDKSGDTLDWDSSLPNGTARLPNIDSYRLVDAYELVDAYGLVFIA